MHDAGSDTRELFNLNHAIEEPWHDVMSVPYHVMMHFNGWDEKFDINVPMIEMTTMDKNKEFDEKIDDNGTGNNKD